jgi:hypothetical protein
MNARRLPSLLLAAVVLTAGTGFVLTRTDAAAETTVAALLQRTHIHGIAVDRGDPERTYLATHHGLYAVTSNAAAELISRTRDDFMGFTPHPTEPGVLYASGHPETGGNLGVIASTDGGRSWTRLADGVGGPVDFHQMDISPADPSVIYGVHGTLQVSRGGGRSWQAVGPPPAGIIDLAASSLDRDVLYAATQTGLLRSTDGGRSFEPAHLLRRPVTMVHVTPTGEVYAFMLGTGLIRTREPDLRWQLVSAGFGEAYVLHLAADGDRLHAVTFDPATHAQAVLVSRDGGVSWTTLEGG